MPAKLLVADAAVSGRQGRLVASNHNKPYARSWATEKGTLRFCDLRQSTLKLAYPSLNEPSAPKKGKPVGKASPGDGASRKG